MQTAPDKPVHLSIAIVVHDSPLSLLASTLSSLAQAVAFARGRGQLDSAILYLVDNASSATYRDQLRDYLGNFDAGRHLRVEFLPQERNLGFGHGHNRVLPMLSSHFHLVLNPDAELAPDALAVGLSHMQARQRTVLLSPRVTTDAGEQEFLCKAYPSVFVLLLRGFAPAFLRGLFRRRLDAYELRAACSGDETVEVEIASGCVMLLRTGVLRAVGGFDEDFFLYFEDFDLSLRIAREGSLVFEPAMQVVHHGGYAARKGWHHVKLFVRSGIHFFRLHGWRWV